MTEPTAESSIRTWVQHHALGMVLLGGAAAWWGVPALLAGGALVSFAVFVVRRRSAWQGARPAGGYANMVTALRLAGVLAIGAFGAGWPPPVVGGVALAVLLADGLDGYLARRCGTASVFGAYFDMETDALYVCLLSLLAFTEEYLGAAILAIGFMRYGYVLLMVVLRRGQKSEPRSFFGRLVAVCMMGALAALFLLPPVLHRPMAWVAAALIVVSFARSIHFQLTH